MSLRAVVSLVGAVVVIATGWYVSFLHGEIARLEGALAERRVAAAPARAPAAPRVAVTSGRALSSTQRQSMLAMLGGAGMSSTNPVWFATVANNAEATAFRAALAGVFEEAGWQVRGNAPVRFSMKPGVFVFAADEEPPDYVTQASAALEAAGIAITATGHGYRAFYEEKKREDPEWVGVEMTPGATYLIVIGRQPAEDPAT